MHKIENTKKARKWKHKEFF